MHGQPIDIVFCKESDKEKLKYWYIIEKLASTNKCQLKIQFISDNEFASNKFLKRFGTWRMTEDNTEFYFVHATI